VLPRSIQILLKKEDEDTGFWERLLKDKQLEKTNVKVRGCVGVCVVCFFWGGDIGGGCVFVGCVCVCVSVCVCGGGVDGPTVYTTWLDMTRMCVRSIGRRAAECLEPIPCLQHHHHHHKPQLHHPHHHHTPPPHISSSTFSSSHATRSTGTATWTRTRRRRTRRSTRASCRAAWCVGAFLFRLARSLCLFVSVCVRFSVSVSLCMWGEWRGRGRRGWSGVWRAYFCACVFVLFCAFCVCAVMPLGMVRPRGSFRPLFVLD
jgi:hypothetical protein